MKRFVGALLIGTACLFALPVNADSGRELFESAGRSYERGNFDKAAAEYEKLVADGFVGSGLYYNLGNAYFRLGDRGRSILWYERARRLSPRDPDIRHNLELVRGELQDEEGTIWEFLDRLLTPQELGWIITGLFWSICSAAGLSLTTQWPWIRRRTPLLAALAALILATLWLGARMHDLRAPWGVVIRAGAQVRSGPGEQFAVGFTVPPGQRVLIISRRGSWMEIGVPSRSLKGWIVDGAADLIEPDGSWASYM